MSGATVVVPSRRARRKAAREAGQRWSPLPDKPAADDSDQQGLKNAPRVRGNETAQKFVVKSRGVMHRIVVDETGLMTRYTEYPKNRKEKPHDKRTARARKTRHQRRETERAQDQWDVTFAGSRGEKLGMMRVRARSVEAAKRLAGETRPDDTRTFRVLPYCEVA